MKFFKILFCLLVSSNFLFAQNQPLEIIGKVIEQQTLQPVEFATVVVVDKVSKKILSGVTTDLGGTFKMETHATDFYIEFSFIGLDNKTITDFSIANGKVDLGTITMNSNSEQLDEVVVRAE